MKFLAAILLVVATVHANSLYHYGWVPGKESVYNFESQLLTGIPEIRESQYAGIKLSAKIRVQSFSDYSLRIKMEQPEFVTLNGQIKRTSTDRIIKEGGSESNKQGHLPEQFKRYLEQPFLVHLKSGVVQSFLVSQEEPVSVTNIKKSVLSQLQLDIAGTRRSQIESNHIQLPLNEEGKVSEHISYFSTSEEFVQGECMTNYAIHKIPQWKINELEENWSMEERKLKGVEYHSSESLSEETSEGKRHCEGKPYYMIIRTRNFDQCKVRPVFQKWTGAEGNCDLAKSNCKSMFNQLSTVTTFVCGELEQFHIRKVTLKNIVEASPIGFNTEERTRTMTQVNMELLKIQSISQRLPIPSSTKEIKSLIYSYPQQTNGELYSASEEMIRKSEAILGIRPILPQPGLTEAPKSLIPVSLEKHEIISQVLQQLNKMAREIYESPESCSSKSDLAGTLTTISQYMRHLSLSELEQLEQQIVSESQSEFKTLEKIFYDTLSLVGTNPSTMLIIKRVESGSLPEPMLKKMVSFSIRSVRFPTKALLSELIKMVKSERIQSHKSIFSSAIVELSNLFYRAYVNPSTMVTAFPTRLYGLFGTKESQVLTEEYIPFLMKMLDQANSEYIRLVVISSLGKLGHMKALKPLLRVAEGQLQQEKEPLVRSLAIYSLKRLAKRNPSEIRPILMSIITNPVEIPEVRIAAVSVLPWSRPTTSELQKLAIRSWMEPSKQVSSFIYSTLKSLAYTEIPDLKATGIKAKQALPIMKPEYFGAQYSHNINFSKFVEYLKTTVSQQTSLVNSKESFIPVRATMKTEYYGPLSAYKVTGLSFTAYTQGMDSLIEKYMHFFGKSTEMSSTVRQQLERIAEELKLKTRQFRTPKVFMQQSYSGIESAWYLDSEIVVEALEKISRKMESGSTKEFSYVSANHIAETNYLGMSESGFPVVSSFAVPVIYALKGSLRTEQVEGMWPKIDAKIIPVFNGKMQSSIGVISPFTQEFIGTGIEMSIHSSIPVEVEAKITRGQFELILRTPSEMEQSRRETETLHGFVLPYTVRKNLHAVKPLSHATSRKEITSGNQKQPIDIPIGQSLGLSGRLIFESDNKFTDFYSYLEKVYQNSPITLLSVAVIPSSLRASSTKILFKPTQSETKEFHLKIKLSTKGPVDILKSEEVNEEELERNGFQSVKKILSMLEGPEAVATVIELYASRRGPSHSKTMKIAAVVGKKGRHESVHTLAAIDLKPHEQEVVGIRFEGRAQLPKLMNRWNVEKLIEEALRLQYDGKIAFGRGGESHEIKFNSQMKKTETQKKSVMESPEYKMCKEEQSKGRKLSTVCAIVRQQAASLDQIEATIEVPKIVRRSPFVNVVVDILRSLAIGQISEYETSQGSSETAVLKIKAKADRTSEVAQAEIRSESEQMKVKNIRLLGWTRNVFPLSMLNRLSSLLTQKMSAYNLPATCRVEPRFIGTFDNKTVEYKVNDCEHVLLLDGSRKLPIAVLARTVNGEEKVVKILSGFNEIKMMPQSGSMRIELNGETIELAPGQTVVKKASSGYSLVELKRYEDVYMVYVPAQGLVVLSNGRRIEVSAPQMLKSRAVGICGDMNGESSADLKTPRMCVLRNKLSPISYMLNKSGSSSSFPRCSGIPSEVRQEYERETSQCIKERIIPTPLLGLYKRINTWNKPVVRAHVVDKQRNQVCISKQMMKICSAQSTYSHIGESVRGGRYMSKPLSVKPKSVEFVCIQRPSSLAQSLEKRALAGEPLYVELEQQQVAFRKVEFEPITCGKPSIESYSSLESSSRSEEIMSRSERNWSY